MSDAAMAGDIRQKPDPELLKRFEAERDAAAADRLAAEADIRQAQESLRQAEEKRRAMQAETDRKLCEMGLLPNCP